MWKRRRRSTQNTSVSRKTEPAGVGGLLRLLIVYLMAFVPLYNISQIIDGFSTVEKYSQTIFLGAQWTHFKIAICILTIAVCLISIAAGYCLWKDHRPSSVPIAIWAFWIIDPISTLLTKALDFLFIRTPSRDFFENEILSTSFLIGITNACTLSHLSKMVEPRL